MRCGNRARFVCLGLGLALTTLPPARASARDTVAEDAAERSRAIIASMDPAREAQEESWLAHLSQMSLSTDGLEYVRHLHVDNRPVEMRLQAPVYHSTRKRKYGLEVEFRF